MVEIDYETIRVAIRKKTGQGRCPLCESTDGWGGGSALARLEVIDHESHNGKPRDPEAERSIIVVPIHCVSCGFMPLLDFSTLMKEHDASR